MNTAWAVFSWWAVAGLLGWAAWPLGFMLFRRFPDGGYLLSKALGALLAGYILWLAASLRLVASCSPAAWFAVVAMAAGSGLSYWWGRGGLKGFLRRQWRRVLGLELLFSLSFLAMVGLRLLNPDLWHPTFGGEKPMDFAYLNAIIKSTYFPPYDPYFAGARLNYYYWGQYLVAFLVRLTGIGPRIAFNLAVPWSFALTVGGAFSLGWALGRRWWAGLGAAYAVALAGNLDGAVQLGRGLFQWASRGEAFAFDYWGSTRLIPYTINEFPFFSFLFADLHPHMLAMPCALLAVGLAIALAWELAGEGGASGLGWCYWARMVPTLLVLGLASGALSAINTWDYPTYLGVAFIAILIGLYRARRGLALGVSLILFAPVLLLSLAFYLPFWWGYHPQGAAGIGLVRERSPLAPLLAIWGLFAFMALGLALGSLRDRREWRGFPRRKWGKVVTLILGTLGVVISAIAQEWGLAILVFLLVGVALSFGRRQGVRRLFARSLVALGLALILGCELFHIRDFLSGGDWYRMNTVFKFYIQAWLLLGVGGMAVLPEALARLRPRWLRGAWLAGFGALLLATGVYPILGTVARVSDRFPGERPSLGTLDGLAFMRYGSFTWQRDGGVEIKLAYDLEAIEWLEGRAEGLPVLVEAPISYYRALGLRASSFSGLPTVVGFHENEQRDPASVAQREMDVARLYSTADEREALDLLDRYRVSYIYVGQLERVLYPAEGLAKFDRLVGKFLDVAYENPGVKIYAVRGMG